MISNIAITLKYTIMKTSTLLIILAILGLMASMTSCSSTTKPVDHKDSVGYAVYESKCLVHPEDNDPLYIPLDQLGINHPGDTVWVEEDGVITTPHEMVKYNGEEGHISVDPIHQVVIKSRMNYNKYYAKGQ
jgi:hypothetical protein